ncbi:hypothetical protein [Clostridium butyricum]|uniref:hypothetical protein n=1 Tax=Clostridium butyricum TaxID=1492 RepID=UPI00325B0EA6
MRVRFKNKIYLCTKVTHPKVSNFLIIATPNGVYTVDMITCEQAELMYNNILINGYCDFSEYEYSN